MYNFLRNKHIKERNKMYPDHMCGDYDLEFDSYVREQVAIKNCEHYEAFEHMEIRQITTSCFCPDCGQKVNYESVRRIFKPTSDEAMQDAEMAAEQAFEARLMGIREY
jgi:hypothetical protein